MYLHKKNFSYKTQIIVNVTSYLHLRSEINATADCLTKKVYLLSPIIIGNGNKSSPKPCMSCIPAILNLLDDVTHQSYLHSRLLVELMTHIQCESKPIANNGENLLPIVTNGYNFLSKLTFYNICYQW